MTQFWHYYSPATSTAGYFDVDLGGPRLGNIPGLVDTALMGEAGMSGQEFDDPNGTLGHAGDAILGLKEIFVVETDCPAVGGTSAAPTFGRRLYTSFVADRTYKRGSSGDSSSLITGVSRVIDTTLIDTNSYLQWRVYTQAMTSANRPAETDIARLTFFLGYQWVASQLFDLGLVNTSSPVALDAVDYRGQRPFNWLDDCAQASGKNFFVYYSEKDGKLGLFYDKIDSSAYPADLALSNVLSECDQSTTFSIASAELFRDPSRVSAGVYLPYANGATYQSQASTADTYGWRDAIAPSANVKTVSKANALALRYLADNDTEDDKITCLVQLPSSKVTGIKAGQRLSAHFSHLPGYESGAADFRVLRRTVRQDFEDPLLYMVELELTPITTASGCAYPTHVAGTTPTFEEEITDPVSDSGTGSNTPLSLSLPGGAPSPGDFLVLTLMRSQSGHAPPDAVTYTLPPCWTVDVNADADGLTDARLQALLTAHHVVLSGDAYPIVVTANASSGLERVYATIARYTGMGSNPTVVDVQTSAFQPNLGTATIPTVTAPAGTPVLVVANVGHEPDYTLSSASAGWTIRAQSKSNGGVRQATAFVDTIVSSPSGGITGTVTSPGGSDDYWIITAVAYQVTT